MSFNWGLIADNLPLLLQGALVTVEITAMSVVHHYWCKFS